MKRYLFTSLLLGALLTACARDSEPAPDEDVAALHQQFHGKYKVIRATSNVPVDINLDGTASTDMADEYEYLESTGLRIDVRNERNAGQLVFLFTQSWLEQYVTTPTGDWKGEVTGYEKGARASQVHQGSVRNFTLSSDRKMIHVQPSTSDTSEPNFRWTRPESVTVEPDGTLTVVNKRRVYTSAGVKDIYITTSYQRYTMTT